MVTRMDRRVATFVRNQEFVNKLLKYLVILNASLALVSLLGSLWAARTAGPPAYWAGAVATVVVGVAASLALSVSFLQSRHTDASANASGAVSGVLLAMIFRMGLPLAALIFARQWSPSLVEAGFLGLLVLNYLFALPLETAMSLRLSRRSSSHESSSHESSTRGPNHSVSA